MSTIARRAIGVVARAIEGHETRNRDLLKRLRELGARLETPRVIDCHFWAPTGEAASLLVERLKVKGFSEVSSSAPDNGGLWSVEGKLQKPAAFVASRKVTKELVGLAAAVGGEYDGWGTRVHEATKA